MGARLFGVQQKSRYETLFPTKIRVGQSNNFVNPSAAKYILLNRERTLEIFNSHKREAQAKNLFDEQIVDSNNKFEMLFLRNYAWQNNLGTLETQNLIKCIGYLGTTGKLREIIERDLFENIGIETLNRLNSIEKNLFRKIN